MNVKGDSTQQNYDGQTNPTGNGKAPVNNSMENRLIIKSNTESSTCVSHNNSGVGGSPSKRKGQMHLNPDAGYEHSGTECSET